MTFPEKVPYPLKISEEQDFSLACDNCNNCTTGCTTNCAEGCTNGCTDQCAGGCLTAANEACIAGCTTGCASGCDDNCQGCTTGEYQVYGIRAQYGGGSVIDANTVDGVSLARKYQVYNTTYCDGTVAIEMFGFLPRRIGSTWLKKKYSLDGYWITEYDNVCERCNNNCFDACDGGCYGTCASCAHCYNGPAVN